MIVATSRTFTICVNIWKRKKNIVLFVLTHFVFLRFETSDGTSRQETGEYKNDTEQQGLVVKGSYKYVAPDGQHISVSYVADKDGYKPTEESDKDQESAPTTPTA